MEQSTYKDIRVQNRFELCTRYDEELTRQEYDTYVLVTMFLGCSRIVGSKRSFLPEWRKKIEEFDISVSEVTGETDKIFDSYVDSKEHFLELSLMGSLVDYCNWINKNP